MDTYTIIVPDDVKVVAAADIASMTSYILIELEDWFEDEIAFIRRVAEPGMQAFDIGANHGVYALAMAARAGEGGHIWAFEPSSRPLSMLRASVVENGFQNRITVIDRALSDHAGTAQMGVFASQSENNSLHRRDGETEEVRLDTLDAVWQELGVPAVDFVKLDAEGEEMNILKAGARFFAENQPLVMFEVKSDDTGPNTALLDAFTAMGYSLYRLLPGLGVLELCDPDAGLDVFQINLFACKPERAARLEERGLLAREVAEEPWSRPLPDVRAALAARPFAAGLATAWRPCPSVEEALAALLAAQDTDRPPPERLGLLRCGLNGLQKALQAEEHPATRLSLLRALRAAGKHSEVLHNLQPLLADGAAAVAGALAERAFLPPLASWDEMPVSDGMEAWAAALLADTRAASRHYSTYFNQECVGGLWDQRANPNSTIGMYRRLFLMFLRAGRTIRFTDRSNDILLSESPKHRNAKLWRALLAD